MELMQPLNLGYRISLIDGYDLGLPGRTGTYVIRERQLTLIETGPSRSVPFILNGLEELGIDPKEIKFIILTHIHLDHAGGAGLLLEACPDARVVVHPKGARHLADPSRLVAGAQVVFGERFDELFGNVVLVPEERMLIRNEGDTLEIGEGRTLHFYDTPGHANHHLAIYDPASGGIFTGDTAGARYSQAADANVTFYLPITSPNQFDPIAMLNSIRRFRDLPVDRFYLGHYGVEENPQGMCAEVESWIRRFVETGEEALAAGEDTIGLQRRLLRLVSGDLHQRGVPERHSIHQLLDFDMTVCAMGLVDYLQKKNNP